jgi:hypothetical protein
MVSGSKNAIDGRYVTLAIGTGTAEPSQIYVTVGSKAVRNVVSEGQSFGLHRSEAMYLLYHFHPQV